MNPTLGAAGTLYARSCIPRSPSLGALPDPGLIFDAVMARKKFKKHPNNISSILWYWATIIIHGLSRSLSSCEVVVRLIFQRQTFSGQTRVT